MSGEQGTLFAGSVSGRGRSKKEHWSGYAKSLVLEAIAVATRKEVLDLLKVLLYPKGLLPEHRAELEGCERGIVWL